MDSVARQTALDRARQGDGQALAELLESFRNYVRVIVNGLWDRRLQGKLEDSDLIQDALLEAHKGFSGFRGTTVVELSVWLRQIAVWSVGHAKRAAVQTAKRDPGKEVRFGNVADGLCHPGSSPSDQAIRREQSARVTEALAQLPADMQQVLLHRHVDGLSHADIARRLGRSEGAVRVLYVRALDRLGQLCREQG